MKRIAFATFLALGMSAGTIAQQSSEPTRTPPGNDRTNQLTFEEADKNKDGKVNQEEGNAIGGFDFSRADTDADASLTRQEYEAAMAKSTARTDGQQGPRSGDRTELVTFDAADQNRDGKIDRDEGNDIDGFNFSRADVDDDASVSRSEFEAAMANATPRG